MKVIVFILSAWMVSSQLANAQDRLRLVHADSLVTRTLSDRVIRELWGKVDMVQGEAFTHCDYAIWEESSGLITLDGQVEIHDGRRHLSAVRVIYDDKTKIETAFSATLVDSAKQLKADTLIYNRNSGIADARSNALLKDMIENAEISAESIRYERGLNHGTAVGNPVIAQSDTASGDTLFVHARFMEAWGEPQRASAKDSVRIFKGNMSAFCDSVDYEPKNQKMVLIRHPRLVQDNQEVTGDTIWIRMDHLKVTGLDVSGKGRVVQTDSSGVNELLGGRIEAEVKADTIRKVIVIGQAQNTYHVAESESTPGMNTLTGDHMVLTFEHGKLAEVDVTSEPGLSTGEFRPKGAPAPETAPEEE